MEDAIGRRRLHRLLDLPGVEQIRRQVLLQLARRVGGDPRAAAEPVDGHVLRDRVVRHVAADEAGDAGDQCPH